MKETLIANFTAEKLRTEGWEVVVSPQQSQLPFDLGSYIPDLIAHRGNEHQLIEIRKDSSRLAPEQVASVADEVKKHLGWKFVLITGDQIDTKGDLRSWENINEELHQIVPAEMNQVMNQAYWLLIWSNVEGMIRRRLVEISGAIVRLPTLAAINNLLSQGEISVEHAQELKRYLSIRNQVAHGFKRQELSANDVLAFLRFARELFNKWSNTTVRES